MQGMDDEEEDFNNYQEQQHHHHLQQQLQQQHEEQEDYHDLQGGEEDYNFIEFQYLNHAAVLIQKIWRGYQTRKILRLFLDELAREAQFEHEQAMREAEEQQEEEEQAALATRAAAEAAMTQTVEGELDGIQETNYLNNNNQQYEQYYRSFGAVDSAAGGIAAAVGQMLSTQGEIADADREATTYSGVNGLGGIQHEQYEYDFGDSSEKVVNISTIIKSSILSNGMEYSEDASKVVGTAQFIEHKGSSAGGSGHHAYLAHSHAAAAAAGGGGGAINSGASITPAALEDEVLQMSRSVSATGSVVAGNNVQGQSKTMNGGENSMSFAQLEKQQQQQQHAPFKGVNLSNLLNNNSNNNNVKGNSNTSSGQITREMYEQELQRLKEIEISRWHLIAARLQNAQENVLNGKDREECLAQLQAISESNKNELLSSMRYPVNAGGLQGAATATTTSSGGNIPLDSQNDASTKSKSHRNIVLALKQEEENRSARDSEASNSARQNNLPLEEQQQQQFTPKLSQQQDIQQLQQQQQQQQFEKLQQQQQLKPISQQQQQGGKAKVNQELAQLYLLLTQETNKDKDKKYLYSSLSLQQSSSNLNSQRNSSRARLPDEDNEYGISSNVQSNQISAVVPLSPEQNANAAAAGMTSSSSNMNGGTSFFERDTFKVFREKKLKEIMQNDQIEDIIRFREQSIAMRHSTEVAIINKKLQENVVSPRTYYLNKEELDKWAKQEHADLKETKQDLEKSIMRAYDLHSKAKRDLDFSNNCSALSNTGAAGVVVVVSGEPDLLATAEQKRDGLDLHSDQEFVSEEFEGAKNQSNLAQDVRIQGKQLDVLERIPSSSKSQQENGTINFDGRIPGTNLFATASENLQNNGGISVIEKKNNIESTIIGNGKISTDEESKAKRSEGSKESGATVNVSQVVSAAAAAAVSAAAAGVSESPRNNNNNNNNQGNPETTSLSEQEDNDDHVSVNSSGSNNSSSGHGVHPQHLSNIAAQEMANHEVFNTINEEIKEKWRMNAQVEERLNEQLNTVECIDKSDRFGISSNLFIIEQYMLSLIEYIRKHYSKEFVTNVNTAFGFSPEKRLKLIHGYDSYMEGGPSEQSLEEFTTLPFVLSEELFIEFEQNIIGNGEEEKDQIIKEFQHIHNKAIFDTFNESLNLFRPYFALGGSPYSWSFHEKNIVFCEANFDNIDKIMLKSKRKVIEWASFLCGIINEHETPPAIRRALLYHQNGGDVNASSDSLNDLDNTNDQSPLQSLLENNAIQPENEYFAQSREERLSRMLLVEIFETEYKWQLYEDEKAEVLMELSDLVFEDLVEEIVEEISGLK